MKFNKPISRREFIKLGGLTAGGLLLKLGMIDLNSIHSQMQNGWLE